MKTTEISWCDSTFNPIMGCTKVSPACANCYAERDMDHRFNRVTWGPHGNRRITSDSNWKQPLKWDREAAERGQPFRVFCASLADVFEDWQGSIQDHEGSELWTNESGTVYRVPEGYGGVPSAIRRYATRRMNMDDVRRRLFQLIDDTPNLIWMLLTKRPENVVRMWPRYNYDACATGDCPHERQDECQTILDRENVWLGTSVENQEYADKRIPELLKCRDLAPVLFLSCEPLLGPVEFSKVTGRADCIQQLGKQALDGIDWVIAGGESGPNARPSHPDWFRSLRDQCEATNTPFHFKQWGEWLPGNMEDKRESPHTWVNKVPPDDSNGSQVCYRVGKKAAGRLLDGVEHNGLPATAVVTCPDCAGKGEMLATGIKYTKGHTGPPAAMLPCFRCNGRRVIPCEMLKWIKEGENVRRWRRDQELGLREAADKIGIKPSTFSSLENGDVDNSNWRELLGIGQ